MVRFVHAFTLALSLLHLHHTGDSHVHGAEFDIDIILGHLNHKRQIARAL